MSDTQGDVALPQGFELLQGRDNYQRWSRAFETFAVSRDVWDIVFGTKKILPKPDLAEYSIGMPSQSESTENSRKQRMTVDKEIVRGTPEPSPAESTESLVERMRFQIAIVAWKTNHEKVQRALSMILYSVNIAIRKELEEFQDPKEAWEWIRKQYKIGDRRMIEMAKLKLRQTTLSKFNNVQEYLGELSSIKKDLLEAGREYTDDDLVTDAIIGLTSDFDGFVDQYYYGPNGNDMTFSQLSKHLVEYESRMKQRRGALLASVEAKDEKGKGKGKPKVDKSIKRC